MRILSSKRILLVILITLTTIFSSHISATNITGTVVDLKDNSPLPQAIIRLVSARDSSFIKGASSDIDGKFQLLDIKNGVYKISISYIGYETQSKRVKASDGAGNVNLGKIAMKENTIMLKETTVVGVKAEIKVKEDTIEYNADSYKTQPNAVVEDLLKRLPGVEISSDGKITSNGKEITKILVDGKEFFSDDPKVATKNIPVGIVDKLQVVDRKSDLARTTGVDDGEDETVINLTVKKGKNNGWFGNATAGYGSDNRYGGNFMVNRFWDGNQISILGGANNTNNLGFSDGNSGRFSRFGGNNGIKTSQNIGINFNVGNGDKFRVGGNVLYSHSDNDARQSSNRQNLFADSTSYYNSNSIARDKGHNIRGDFRLKWEIDSLNVLEFRPNFSLNYNNSAKTDTSSTNAGDLLRTPVNKSQNQYNSDGNSFEFGGELVFNHKFRNKIGRSFSAQVRYNLSNVKENGSTYSRNTYYLLDDKEEIVDQVYDNHTWSNNVRGRLTWTEPLGDVKNARYLTFAYTLQYKFNNADKLVYDHNGSTKAAYDPYSITSRALSNDVLKKLTEDYGTMVLTNPELFKAAIGANDILNEDLSNRFRNDFLDQKVQIGFKQVRKNYNFDVGFAVNPSMSQSVNLINDAKNIPTRWVWNVAPYLRYRYKINKKSYLSADYRARSSSPTMSQLQPVADTSNPLRIVVGNPNLKPTFTNRFNIRFSDYNETSQRSIMAMATAQFASNSIISTSKNDPITGGQTSTYENVNGVWNARLMGMISMPLRNKHFTFSNHLFTQYSNNIGYINAQYNRSGSFMVSESASMAYRTDVIELEVRPYYNIQTTHNTVQAKSTPTVHSFGGTLNASYYLPFGLSINTDMTYSGTKGYSEGYNQNQWLWNANVSYQFLQERSATVAFNVYDILHQKQNISRSVTANYIQDVSYNTLTRYFMVSFSYRFNTFGGKDKIPQSKYQDFGRPQHPRRPSRH
ncbi:MAG: TonB-dependent receptor [Muribaculaceae bacterium]